jgi:hypothetical protein
LENTTFKSKLLRFYHSQFTRKSCNLNALCIRILKMLTMPNSYYYYCILTRILFYFSEKKHKKNSIKWVICQIHIQYCLILLAVHVYVFLCFGIGVNSFDIKYDKKHMYMCYEIFTWIATTIFQIRYRPNQGTFLKKNCFILLILTSRRRQCYLKCMIHNYRGLIGKRCHMQNVEA